MIRNSMRSTRLLSWRCLRWAIVVPALPFLWWACTSHPLTQPNPEPEMQTDVYISVAPVRLLDLVFMVDNSPSMAPKVEKMNAQFPKLIKSLEDPTDGTLPDVRVAVINSDLGTAGAFRDNSCAAKQLPDGTTSIFGDLGRFQMLKSPNDCSFNDGALFLEYKAGQPVNYSGDINNVFACLAKNLGTMGCGEEHIIQAFEFALVAKGVGNEKQQEAFLRRNAYLGLVFLTDEDDCSAATNDRLFGDLPDARGDSASLRCATRAHKCGGRSLAQLGTDDLPEYPTVRDFNHAFNDCEAWVGDWCGNDEDTSKPTPHCNPLRDVRTFADEIKSLRPDDPDNQILVAGIFGWPMDDPNDPNVFKRNMEQAQYKIAKVPNPNTADTIHPQVYDYWPVCYDPDHMPSDARKDPTTGFDVQAAGWGATGGLRNAAFVDEFGENGLKFSICQRDFSDSMKKIGDAIAKKLQNLCVDYKLVDTDKDRPGVQADCRVVWRIPKQDPKTQQITYEESPTSLPQCPDGATPDNIDGDCWYLTRDKQKCEVNGQLIQVMRTRQEIKDKPQLEAGTKIGMQCRTCTDPVLVSNANDEIQPGCDYQLQ